MAGNDLWKKNGNFRMQIHRQKKSSKKFGLKIVKTNDWISNAISPVEICLCESQRIFSKICMSKSRKIVPFLKKKNYTCIYEWRSIHNAFRHTKHHIYHYPLLWFPLGFISTTKVQKHYHYFYYSVLRHSCSSECACDNSCTMAVTTGAIFRLLDDSSST